MVKRSFTQKRQLLTNKKLNIKMRQILSIEAYRYMAVKYEPSMNKTGNQLNVNVKKNAEIPLDRNKN